MTAIVKEPFADFAAILTLDKCLGPLTTYGVGGTARYFLEPADPDQLANVVRTARTHGIAIRSLGSGANLLVAADVLNCAVVSLAKLNTVERSGNRITAGAGAEMQPLIVQAVEWGLSGLEGLAGIPGTLGGFVAMNAGGKYGEVSHAIESVTVIRPTGECETRLAGSLRFAYRTAALGEDVVAAATFELRPGDPVSLRARRRQILQEKLATQPLGEKSPGCVFKNPPGDSAGRLIEAAGMKNQSVGAARVSEKHTNFILNTGGATVEDILSLIKRVRSEVARACGVTLELELKVWS